MMLVVEYAGVSLWAKIDYLISRLNLFDLSEDGTTKKTNKQNKQCEKRDTSL